MVRTILILSLFGILGCTSDETTEVVEEPSDPESGRLIGITEAHNEIRREYGVPDLIWDEDLAEVSFEWATFLANDGCYLEHNWDSPLGENLYWATFQQEAKEVVLSWASEVEFYDYDSNSCEDDEMCGHYTQLIWSTTQRVGCDIAYCPDDSEIWMCNYDPAGNWSGEKPY